MWGSGVVVVVVVAAVVVVVVRVRVVLWCVYGVRCMVYRAWCMVHGAWCMGEGYGVWGLVWWESGGSVVVCVWRENGLQRAGVWRVACGTTWDVV